MSDDYFPFSADLTKPEVRRYWRLVAERLQVALLPDDVAGYASEISEAVRHYAAQLQVRDTAWARSDELGEGPRSALTDAFLEPLDAAVVELVSLGLAAEGEGLGSRFGGMLDAAKLLRPATREQTVRETIGRLQAGGAPASVVARIQSMLPIHEALGRVEQERSAQIRIGNDLEYVLADLNGEFQDLVRQFACDLANIYRKGGAAHEALFGARGLELSN